MARTTAAKVKEVLMRDYDSRRQPSLTPFIDSASALVDDLEDAADPALTASRLALLETWLAAHNYAMSDQPYSEQWTGKSKATYHGSRGESLGKYLEASKYGQEAIKLDKSGYLAALQAELVLASAGGGQRVTASFAWLGKPPSGQVPYDQRD